VCRKLFARGLLPKYKRNSTKGTPRTSGTTTKIVTETPLRLPSGYVKIAIENGHRNSGFFQ